MSSSASADTDFGAASSPSASAAGVVVRPTQKDLGVSSLPEVFSQTGHDYRTKSEDDLKRRHVHTCPHIDSGIDDLSEINWDLLTVGLGTALPTEPGRNSVAGYAYTVSRVQTKGRQVTFEDTGHDDRHHVGVDLGPFQRTLG